MTVTGRDFPDSGAAKEPDTEPVCNHAPVGKALLDTARLDDAEPARSPDIVSGGGGAPTWALAAPDGDKTSFVYLLRDAATGLYFVQERENGFTEVAPPASCYIWCASPHRARQYSTGYALKWHVRHMTGLSVGDVCEPSDAPSGGGDSPATSSREGLVHLPFVRTFEIVMMTPLSKTEIRAVPLAPWFDEVMQRLWITSRYGRTVRHLYEAIRRTQRVAEFPFILRFRPPEEEVQQQGEQLRITDAERSYIRKTLHQNGIFGIEVVGDDAIVMAVSSIAEATVARLSIAGFRVDIIEVAAMLELCTSAESSHVEPIFCGQSAKS